MERIEGTKTEEAYLGKPLRTFKGWYVAETDSYYEHAVPVHLEIHPNNSRRVIVNIPGTRGIIDGYAQKYKILGHHIQSQGLAAIVRTGNDFTNLPTDTHLKSALKYTKEHAWEICGEPEPEIFLMGFSAGASAIAARAHQYPQVTKILLCAPATSLRDINVRSGIEKFKGEVYVVIGENDENVGTKSGQTLYDWATNASHKELFVIPDCDHQFRGEKNGRIMSQAPFYAFGKGEKPLFPDPTGGIKLYD